jgi:hypothetical protein
LRGQFMRQYLPCYGRYDSLDTVATAVEVG